MLPVYAEHGGKDSHYFRQQVHGVLHSSECDMVIKRLTVAKLSTTLSGQLA